MLTLLWAVLSLAFAADPARGAVLAGLGLCEACHTAPGGAPYAGGYALETGFGTWIGPNLTPDYQTGLGAWEEADFVRAMRHGRAPSGRAYAPSFPYPWYTALSDAELADLWAWLQSIPPVSQTNPPHEVPGRYRWRASIAVWRLLYFDVGPMAPGADAVSRGAVWVEGVGHCGACHTPRNALGGPRRALAFTGGDPPEAGPDLTPVGLRGWSADDWDSFLSMGMTPGGDFVGGHMGALVEGGTAKLSARDRADIAAYFLALPE